MPDKATVYQGSGGNTIDVSTDTLTFGGQSVEVQRVKIALGPDGTYQADLAAGQKASTGSLPVVIASDQIVPVSATALPLPAGAATDAKQDTGNTSLASLDTKLGEVQAGPTANTLLDRLKALLTGIVLAAGGNIIGKVGIDQTADGTTNKVFVGNSPTVTANAGTNLNTSLLALDSTVAKDSSLTTIDNDVKGSQKRFLRNPGDTANMGDVTNPVRIDPTGTTTQPVSLPVGSSSVSDGIQTFISPGTPAQLPAQVCKMAHIIATETNRGIIVVGDSGVVAQPPFARKGIALWAGDSVRLPVSNLNVLYADGTSWGDTYSWLAL